MRLPLVGFVAVALAVLLGIASMSAGQFNQLQAGSTDRTPTAAKQSAAQLNRQPPTTAATQTAEQATKAMKGMKAELDSLPPGVDPLNTVSTQDGAAQADTPSQTQPDAAAPASNRVKRRSPLQLTLLEQAGQLQVQLESSIDLNNLQVQIKTDAGILPKQQQQKAWQLSALSARKPQRWTYDFERQGIRGQIIVIARAESESGPQKAAQVWSFGPPAPRDEAKEGAVNHRHRQIIMRKNPAQ